MSWGELHPVQAGRPLLQGLRRAVDQVPAPRPELLGQPPYHKPALLTSQWTKASLKDSKPFSFETVTMTEEGNAKHGRIDKRIDSGYGGPEKTGAATAKYLGESKRVKTRFSTI